MNEVAKKLSEEMGLPVKTILAVYYFYWRFIRDTIAALPLDKDLTKEEYEKLKVNFNVPFLGKFRCTYGDKYKED